jgi:hypothetical protein
VPESAGGFALRAGALSLARNLKNMNVRILHTEGDQIVPYADAQAMESAIKEAGGKVELITYQDKDYLGQPFPQRHPGPHHLRLKNVLEWIPNQKRTIPQTFTRVIRYSQQGNEGRWILTPPAKLTDEYTVTCSEKNGVLSIDKGPAGYLVSPEDVIARKTFTVNGKEVGALPDLKLMLTRFKSSGDASRLAAAQIAVN